MKSETTEAIVLRRTNYGEADRIIQFSTPLGRRSAMARGVRKSRSKLAGGVELLSLSQVVLRHGRGEISTLVQARMIKFYKNILDNYDKLQFAYEAMKMVVYSSEIIDEPEWFNILKETLEALNNKTVNFALIKTWFYLNYAKLLGNELSLVSDVSGQALSQNRRYIYDKIEHGLRHSGRGEITADHIKLLRLMSSYPLRVVTQVGGIEGILPDCWLIARSHAELNK